MATTINASTSAGLVSTADTSGVLQLQAQGTTVLNGELGKALALQGATSTTGCGIAFPATQVTSTNANTLDDYEEGTWLPTFTTAGTAFTSITYDIQNGSYVKIGSYVYCEAHLRVATVSGGSGVVLLSNFPFATLGSSFPNPGGYFQLASGFVTNTPSSLDASGASATTYNMLYRTSANGALSTSLTTTDIAVGSFIRATVVFQTS